MSLSVSAQFEGSCEPLFVCGWLSWIITKTLQFPSTNTHHRHTHVLSQTHYVCCIRQSGLMIKEQRAYSHWITHTKYALTTQPKLPFWLHADLLVQWRQPGSAIPMVASSKGTCDEFRCTRHTQTHADTTQTHAHKSQPRTDTHTHTHTDTQRRTQTSHRHTHRDTQTHTYIYTHTHIDALRLTQIHAHTQAHTHREIHTVTRYTDTHQNECWYTHAHRPQAHADAHR
jgi:hypothetical protein